MPRLFSPILLQEAVKDCHRHLLQEDAACCISSKSNQWQDVWCCVASSKGAVTSLGALVSKRVLSDQPWCTPVHVLSDQPRCTHSCVRAFRPAWVHSCLCACFQTSLGALTPVRALSDQPQCTLCSCACAFRPASVHSLLCMRFQTSLSAPAPVHALSDQPQCALACARAFSTALVHYGLCLTRHHADCMMNPDQRITEDVEKFCFSVSDLDLWVGDLQLEAAACV
eukprot:1136290-Pelagomonas_calceolata.AAC.1